MLWQQKRYPHISQFNVFSYRNIRSKQPYLNDEKKKIDDSAVSVPSVAV